MSVTDKTIAIVPAPIEAPEEVALFEIRKKIYARAVHGWFARWRWALVFLTQAIFYGLPWLAWNDRQAVLLDLGARKFYIFGLVFWPQDVIYLTILLVLSAFTLFLFTAIAGRLWCGYACPQTVYTQIFQWVERKIEGERVAQMRLDAAAFSLEKVVLKVFKHMTWLAIAAWTGYTFVGYFQPIRDLGVRTITWQLGGWETFWLAFYSLTTYGNAGWLREQVCKYMCPYARFQSVMFDRDTLVITYDTARGEPRGSRRRNADTAKLGLGHCVDCNICVQVCPTGIDIRKGLQYECIGCAACIDGCNQVMDKMGYPQGLIRYTTENALAKGYDKATMWKRVFRFRTILYLAVLAAVTTAAGVSLYLREPLKVDVMRDRGTLAREASPGIIENTYRLQIMNTDETPREFAISATGLDGIRVVGVDGAVAVEGATSKVVPLSVQVPQESGRPGTSNRIEFVVEAVHDAKMIRHEKSTFLFPR